jgi:hypothetical protein
MTPAGACFMNQSGPIGYECYCPSLYSRKATLTTMTAKTSTSTAAIISRCDSRMASG